MRDILNRKSFQSFKQRCASAGVHEVHVQRQQTKKGVRLQYNARDPRSKKLFTAEWALPFGPAAEEAQAGFLTMLEAEGFVVHARFKQGDEAAQDAAAAAATGADDAAAPAGEEPSAAGAAKPNKTSGNAAKSGAAAKKKATGRASQSTRKQARRKG